MLIDADKVRKIPFRNISCIFSRNRKDRDHFVPAAFLSPPFVIDDSHGISEAFLLP
jgi:hypothetical protein